MLTAAEFAEFDLPDVVARTRTLALRLDRYRREAESIGVERDTPETYRRVQAAGRDADTAADLERIVATLAREIAACAERPAAQVLQLVPRPDPALPIADPVVPAIRRRPLDRLMAALGRPTAKVA